jgi:hypothetical protein
MSLRRSRIHRSRKCAGAPGQFSLSNKRAGRRNRFQPEGDECPSELPRLPACRDDEDGEGEPCDTAGLPVGLLGSSLKLRHLKVAADRGHLEAMYLLAQECEDRVARIHWLTLAAERGHVPAMHDLGLASVALHERRRWLLRAARHGWAEAMAELGDVECS